MITELRLHRTVHDIQLVFKDYLVELRHHLSLAERAQITAAFARGASRVLFGHVGEIRAAFNLCLEIVGRIFAGD